MFLGPLVLAGIITAIVLAVRRGARQNEAQPGSAPPSELVVGSGGGDALSDTLDRWVAHDLLSPDQARLILEHERSVAAPPVASPMMPLVAPPVGARIVEAAGTQRRIPVFAEALGYLGGVLALAGLVLLAANYWPDLPTSVRLLLSLATTVALVGAGALVDEQSDPALARLRWFVWMLASAAAALFTGVLTVDGLDVDTPEFVVAACAGAVAVTSGVLWWWRDRPIQELLFFAGAIVGAATFVAGVSNGGFGGLTAWLLAAAVLAAGLRGLTPLPIVPHVVGAIGIMIGAFVMVPEWMGAGPLLVTATTGGLLLLAALPQLTMSTAERVVLIIVAGFGGLQGVPMTLAHFARDAGGATGLVTWAIGGILVAAGARLLLRVPVVAELIGGLGLIGGAALTGTEWPNFAPLFGIGTAITLLVIGMLPGKVLYSLLGSLGLLINVPWTIGRFFPGEGRAPLLILVSGVVIVAVAVILSRQSSRLRTELTLRTPDTTPIESADDISTARRANHAEPTS